jgi:hypothetical protein
MCFGSKSSGPSVTNDAPKSAPIPANDPLPASKLPSDDPVVKDNQEARKTSSGTGLNLTI